MRRALLGIAIVLLCLTLAGGVGAVFPSAWGLLRDEYPLGDARGVCVDGSGRLYVGIQGYHRIQVYDLAGNYLDTWEIPGKGRRGFSLRRGPDSRIELLHLEVILTYSGDGQVVHRRRSGISHSDFVREYPGAGEYACVDPATGVSYELRTALLWPRVVAMPAGGREKVVVSPEPLLWLLTWPFPGMVLIWPAGLTWYVWKRLSRKRWPRRSSNDKADLDADAGTMGG